MRIVTIVCLIFNMSCRNGDTASALFWCLVNLIISLSSAPPASAITLVIAAVNVVLPWSTWPMYNVHMRLGSVKSLDISLDLRSQTRVRPFLRVLHQPRLAALVRNGQTACYTERDLDSLNARY